MRTTAARLAAVSLAATLVLTACGSADGDADPTSGGTTSSSAAVDPSGPAKEGKVAVSVKGGSGDKAPTITLDTKPVTADVTTAQVLTEGKGAEVSDKDLVSLDLAMFNGKDGTLLPQSETYTQQPAGLDLSSSQTIPGLLKAIRGQKVGSRVVAVIPPAEAFGAQGQPQLGIGPDDHIVLVYDLRSASRLLDQAKGKAVPPKSGLPAVTWHADKPADVKVAGATQKAPTKTVVQPLIAGTGATVKKGQTVYVDYTGALAKDGTVFDSSKRQGGGPFSFPLGQGQVIEGWDTGLEGQKVGSRLLLVIPADEGYGDQGSPDGTIGKGDTLVFVVDILGAV